MRVQLRTYNYTNSRNYNKNTPSKQNTFEGSFYHTNKKYRLSRLNPVMSFFNKTFERSLNVSRNRIQPIIPELNACTKEVVLQTEKKDYTYGWDINKNKSKKYVVALHGTGQNISNNQSLYKSIVEQTRYAVFAPEYRGFGRNKNSEITPDTILEDTSAAIEYLKNYKDIKPENICILGHSLGGFAASRLAQKYPDTGRLILVSSVDLPDQSMNLNNLVKNHLPSIIRFAIKNFKMLQRPLFQLFDTIDNIKKLDMPIDIIHSKNDRVIKPSTSKNLASHCRNLNSLTILDKGGHTLEENKINAVVSALNG